jgi:hypothetical protein
MGVGGVLNAQSPKNHQKYTKYKSNGAFWQLLTKSTLNTKQTVHFQSYYDLFASQRVNLEIY